MAIGLGTSRSIAGRVAAKAAAPAPAAETKKVAGNSGVDHPSKLPSAQKKRVQDRAESELGMKLKSGARPPLKSDKLHAPNGDGTYKASVEIPAKGPLVLGKARTALFTEAPPESPTAARAATDAELAKLRISGNKRPEGTFLIKVAVPEKYLTALKRVALDQAEQGELTIDKREQAHYALLRKEVLRLVKEITEQYTK